MEKFIFLALPIVLTSCVATNASSSTESFSIGDLGSYHETIENDPETIRKSREMQGVIFQETYRKE